MSERSAYVQNGLLYRARIDELLKAGLQNPLVIVAAGAGFGKTTTLRAFCGTCDRKVLWVHLQKMVQDRARFWQLLAAAAQQDLPPLAEWIRVNRFDDVFQAPEGFLAAMTQAAGGDDVLLVIDGADRICDKAVHRLLAAIAGAGRPDCCLMLMGREGFFHGRDYGDHFFIGAHHLAFSKEETRTFFTFHGRELDEAELERLQDFSGGWPLILHTLAVDTHWENRQPFLEETALRVLHRLADQHYFSGYDEAARQLLVTLSHFETFTLELLKAAGVRDLPRARRLLGDHAFISYDYTDGSYRFHDAYRHFLTQMQPLLDPGEKAAFLCRAGDWFHQKNLPRQALDCYWQSGEYDRFLDVLLEMQAHRVGAGFSSWVLERLDRLPEEYGAVRREVRYFKALAHVKQAQIGKAMDLLVPLASELDGEPRDLKSTTLLRDVYLTLIDLCLFRADMTACGGYMQRALALSVVEEGLAQKRGWGIGNNEVFFLPDTQSGGLERARDSAFAVARAMRPVFAPSECYALLFAAEAAYYSANIPEALAHSTKAIRSAALAQQYDIAANALYLQLRIALYTGAYDNAKALLEELADYIESNDLQNIAGLLDCAKGLFALGVGDVDKSVFSTLANERTAASAIGRYQTVLATCQYETGDYFGAYTTLLRLDSTVDERVLWSERVVGEILKAGCLSRMGEMEKAVHAFQTAYDRTWQNGLDMYFIERGGVTIAMLNLIAKEQVRGLDATWLTRIRQAAAEHQKRTAATAKLHRAARYQDRPHPRALTPRETDVLDLLNKGLDRGEIAAALDVTLHGVKKHIANIYEKLGAMNRVDALNVAALYGLVERPAPEAD